MGCSAISIFSLSVLIFASYVANMKTNFPIVTAKSDETTNKTEPRSKLTSKQFSEKLLSHLILSNLYHLAFVSLDIRCNVQSILARKGQRQGKPFHFPNEKKGRICYHSNKYKRKSSVQDNS
jgi:hypothetical protein